MLFTVRTNGFIGGPILADSHEEALHLVLNGWTTEVPGEKFEVEDWNCEKLQFTVWKKAEK